MFSGPEGFKKPSLSEIWLNKLDLAKKQLDQNGEQAMKNLIHSSTEIWDHIQNEPSLLDQAKIWINNFSKKPEIQRSPEVIEMMVNPHTWLAKEGKFAISVRYEALRHMVSSLFAHDHIGK